ncbi:hypothetical protein, conserved [Trypanosoma brucei gambiense DAL972]|uniref:Uncharacterized protein n=1 Tax=Trypanosoma brucei gambiense (strain MHOM/CI/86/DAL972) TaxID=679716 RepID=C9ZLZ6_TRYB9|nr:hypothetical protein, conserved [Trypanosoma brucei gambiense DAL972]CBH10421.1 hypothetical protein, conserved [Trypanosoma brucei gambiense DAL972]|eukprot:XP_011772711.1 hypothetical protein, conserved [Trypanosoma brucei gambiense DAL972]
MTLPELAEPCALLRVSVGKQRRRYLGKQKHAKRIVGGSERYAEEVRIRNFIKGVEPLPPVKECEVMDYVRKLKLDDLTDDRAAHLTSPYSLHAHIMREVLEELTENICASVQNCEWNKPTERREWDMDFRFLHEWWLSLRTLPYREEPNGHYPPLIPWSERGKEAENQLLADVALKIRQSKSPLYLLHLDHINLTPEQTNVLLLDGVFRNNNSGVETFSAQFCNIGPASLLVILLILNHATQLEPQVENLHLAYNWIDASCVNMLTTLLPLTSITRLSLRGNRFGGGDVGLFQEFLMGGCMFLEELDLGYTSLSAPEVYQLIRTIPLLGQLRVLLLDGVPVPEGKAASLLRAIQLSQLIKVSLIAIPACSSDSYLGRVAEACRKHWTGRSGKGSGWYSRGSGSFFEAFDNRASTFFRPRDRSALPPGYRPFTTNDPSLHPWSRRLGTPTDGTREGGWFTSPCPASQG